MEGGGGEEYRKEREIKDRRQERLDFFMNDSIEKKEERSKTGNIKKENETTSTTTTTTRVILLFFSVFRVFVDAFDGPICRLTSVTINKKHRTYCPNIFGQFSRPVEFTAHFNMTFSIGDVIRCVFVVNTRLPRGGYTPTIDYHYINDQ